MMATATAAAGCIYLYISCIKANAKWDGGLREGHFYSFLSFNDLARSGLPMSLKQGF